MEKLLETLKIINGEPQHLEYHQARFNQTRKILYDTQTEIALEKLIHCPFSSGTYRCRIIYTDYIEHIEYLPYQDRQFRTFQIVTDDSMTYPFKFLNRDSLNQLVAQKGLADDILIVKNGLITDTSIANVAFWENDTWVTPAVPLLKGTTRQRWLTEKRMVAKDITVTDLKKFSKMALMNAMIGFYVIEDFQVNIH